MRKLVRGIGCLRHDYGRHCSFPSGGAQTIVTTAGSDIRTLKRFTNRGNGYISNFMPLWTDKVQAIAGIVYTILTLAYVIVTLVGFLLLRRQIQQVDSSTRGETYGELYGQQHSITQFFINNLQLRPYFYDNQEISSADADFAKIMAVAEMVADFLEHIYLQLPNLPEDVREGWESYMVRIYGNSPALRLHCEDNASWYSDELIQMLRSRRANK
jgi:hypothetical protein